MSKVRILAFAGSARQGSYNKKLARLAASAAERAGAEATFLDLRDLPMPLFDQDLEASLPAEQPEAKRFKDLLRAHDALVIASPENNSTYSALLKNVLDWASRKREGEKSMECFESKPVLLLSTSPGALGGLRGLQTLRLLLGQMRMLVLPDQLAIGAAMNAFDEQGALKDPKQQAALDAAVAQLVSVATRLKR